MISYEAVESAARVLIEDGRHGIPWGDAPEDDRAEVMARVRAILEAAAPHMQQGRMIPDKAIEAAHVPNAELHAMGIRSCPGCQSTRLRKQGSSPAIPPRAVMEAAAAIGRSLGLSIVEQANLALKAALPYLRSAK